MHLLRCWGSWDVDFLGFSWSFPSWSKFNIQQTLFQPDQRLSPRRRFKSNWWHQSNWEDDWSEKKSWRLIWENFILHGHHKWQLPNEAWGGAYQEASQKELSDSDVDNPAALHRRRRKVKRNYYGLRHSEIILMWRSIVPAIFITYLPYIHGPYYIHAPLIVLFTVLTKPSFVLQSLLLFMTSISVLQCDCSLYHLPCTCCRWVWCQYGGNHFFRSGQR